MTVPTYIVQSFYEQGRRLIADQPRKVNSEKAAIDGARRLVERKAGVVAFSVVYDVESEVTSEPVVLFKAGKLPPELVGE